MALDGPSPAAALATYMSSFSNLPALGNTLTFSETTVEGDDSAEALARGGGFCFKVCTPVCQSNTCNGAIEAVAQAMNVTQEESLQVRAEI